MTTATAPLLHAHGVYQVAKTEYDRVVKNQVLATLQEFLREHPDVVDVTAQCEYDDGPIVSLWCNTTDDDAEGVNETLDELFAYEFPDGYHDFSWEAARLLFDVDEYEATEFSRTRNDLLAQKPTPTAPDTELVQPVLDALESAATTAKTEANQTVANGQTPDEAYEAAREAALDELTELLR